MNQTEQIRTALESAIREMNGGRESPVVMFPATLARRLAPCLARTFTGAEQDGCTLRFRSDARYDKAYILANFPSRTVEAGGLLVAIFHDVAYLFGKDGQGWYRLFWSGMVDRGSHPRS